MNRVLAALLAFIALACQSSSPRVVPFHDPGCAVTFSYPAGWRARVSKVSHRASCEVLLFASAAKTIDAADDPEAIRIQLYNEPLQAGIHHGGFERDDDGGWVQRRGGGSTRGNSIKTAHASGVEGLVIIRGEGREYPIAVLGNDERSVVISGEGLQEASAGAFDLVVTTMDLRQ